MEYWDKESTMGWFKNSDFSFLFTNFQEEKHWNRLETSSVRWFNDISAFFWNCVGLLEKSSHFYRWNCQKIPVRSPILLVNRLTPPSLLALSSQIFETCLGKMRLIFKNTGFRCSLAGKCKDRFRRYDTWGFSEGLCYLYLMVRLITAMEKWGVSKSFLFSLALCWEWFIFGFPTGNMKVSI